MLGLSWIKNNYTGIDYLASIQNSDGSISTSPENIQNKIWAISYVIPAVVGKSWNEIMHTVSKPDNIVINQNPISDPIRTPSVIVVDNVKKNDKIELPKNTPQEIIPPVVQVVVPETALTAAVIESGAETQLKSIITKIVNSFVSGFIKIVQFIGL